MTSRPPLILITNDDGIDSPGLLAAAEAVAPLGELLIVAPKTQQTGAGRSFRKMDDLNIYRHELQVNQKTVTAYSILGTPAQAVGLAMRDLADRPINLTVSGINFGENIGSGVTVSGTVGAALQAASAGVPALAVSLETSPEYHIEYSDRVDFSTAKYFTRQIAQYALKLRPWPIDVDILKIDIPAQATPETEWRVTRVSRQAFHIGLKALPEERGLKIRPGYTSQANPEALEQDSDTWALHIDKIVSVSPLSIDLTSRINLQDLHDTLSQQENSHAQ